MLRKKGVPFVERLPADPHFRAVVRPRTGSHRIPQLYSPDDDKAVQDTVAILDFVEERFPELPAFPPTPVQRTFVHLMEVREPAALQFLQNMLQAFHPCLSPATPYPLPGTHTCRRVQREGTVFHSGVPSIHPSIH